METETETPRPITPVTSTTRRGFATASFSLGLWGLAVFWWYPFGFAVAALGVLFGVIALLLGIRTGRGGENLALAGIAFGLFGVGFGLAVYRVMQTAFEGAPSADWLRYWPSF
jgi:hypothetical protein